MAGRKKTKVNEVPIDKVESFMYANYRKIIIASAAVLIGFVVIYTVSEIMSVNADRAVTRVAEAEAGLSFSASPADIEAFKNLAAGNSVAKDYIYYKAGVLESASNKAEALNTLSLTGGRFKEFAEGLAFDLGSENVNPSSYLSSGELKPLWYYRAVLAAEGDEKSRLLAEFGAKYPDNTLYELVKKWES